MTRLSQVSRSRLPPQAHDIICIPCGRRGKPTNGINAERSEIILSPLAYAMRLPSELDAVYNA